MTPLASRRHPFVAQCRELAANRRSGDPLVLLDGPHLIGDALAAGVPLVAVAIAPRMLADPTAADLLAALRASPAELFAATEQTLEAASPVRSPAGIVAIARFEAAGPQRVFAAGTGLVVAAVGVQDPGNLGAIVRVADAAGAAGMVVTTGSADPLGWKALRGSAGSALRVPLATGLAADEACATARAAGMRIIATCPAGGTAHHALDLTRPALLLLGGEGPGLPADLIAGADVRLRIPLPPQVESLNVAVAAGVILFEAQRQRHQG